MTRPEAAGVLGEYFRFCTMNWNQTNDKPMRNPAISSTPLEGDISQPNPSDFNAQKMMIFLYKA
jgi:hypothetical protein